MGVGRSKKVKVSKNDGKIHHHYYDNDRYDPYDRYSDSYDRYPNRYPSQDPYHRDPYDQYPPYDRYPRRDPYDRYDDYDRYDRYDRYDDYDSDDDIEIIQTRRGRQLRCECTYI